MDAMNFSTTEHIPLGRVSLQQALGVKVGERRWKYLPGHLIVYEPREEERAVARVVADDGAPNLKVEPFSVYREGFLPAIWLPRFKVLGEAQ